MPEKCPHGLDVPPEVWVKSNVTTNCRICWLARRREALSRPPAPIVIERSRLHHDCMHLGAPVDHQNASGAPSGCRGCWRHACAKHGSCTIREKREGVAWCQDCPDFDADA